MEKKLLFALDIGTRSIVGLIGEKTAEGIRVLGGVRHEHTTRAMLDGQIHDVPEVAKVIRAIKLKLENDILYFFSGSEDSVTTDSAIAYFSSGKLYVNDVQVLSSLRIGGYAWVPESGNLNFKKIAG